MKTDKRYPPRQPYGPPRKPERPHYKGVDAKNGKVLFLQRDVLAEDWDEESYYSDHDEEKPPSPPISFCYLTLQDIVNLAPPGAKLSDISFRTYMPRMQEYEDIYIDYAERDLEAEEATYQRALEEYENGCAEYRLEHKKYEEELADYESWKKDQDIKELEEKLRNLKK